jgi:hypothetical protein
MWSKLQAGLQFESIVGEMITQRKTGSASIFSNQAAFAAEFPFPLARK